MAFNNKNWGKKIFLAQQAVQLIDAVDMDNNDSLGGRKVDKRKKQIRGAKTLPTRASRQLLTHEIETTMANTRAIRKKSKIADVNTPTNAESTNDKSKQIATTPSDFSTTTTRSAGGGGGKSTVDRGLHVMKSKKKKTQMGELVDTDDEEENSETGQGRWGWWRNQFEEGWRGAKRTDE